RHAARTLHDGVEAAARGPGTGAAPGRELDGDDAGTERRERFGAEAARRQRARAIALREDIAAPLADEADEPGDIACLAEIEKRRAFAEAGVDLDVAGLRQMRSGDLEHLGTVLGERSRAGGPGQDARQI